MLSNVKSLNGTRFHKNHYLEGILLPIWRKQGPDEQPTAASGRKHMQNGKHWTDSERHPVWSWHSDTKVEAEPEKDWSSQTKHLKWGTFNDSEVSRPWFDWES
jgi:hypothetical protein